MHMLRELGDTSDDRTLSLRFHRMRRRLEGAINDEETAGLFAQLTLVFHDLNLLLRDAFYPELPREGDPLGPESE